MTVHSLSHFANYRQWFSVFSVKLDSLKRPSSASPELKPKPKRQIVVTETGEESFSIIEEANITMPNPDDGGTSLRASIDDLRDMISKKFDELNVRLDVLEKRQRDQNEKTEKRLDDIEKSLLDLERKMILKDAARETYSRSWNVRIAPPKENVEDKEENCEEIVRQHLKNKGGIDLAATSIVHRVGKKERNKGRMFLVQFVRKEDARKLMRLRKDLWAKDVRVFDDMSYLHRLMKKQVGPLMESLYQEGRTVLFRDGRLLVDGREKRVSYEDAINEFMAKA